MAGKYKFNPDKHKATFEQMFGKGSYSSGLAEAREIGRTKAQAELAKKDYSIRMSEARKKAKKEEARNSPENTWAKDVVESFRKEQQNKEFQKQSDSSLRNPNAKEGQGSAGESYWASKGVPVGHGSSKPYQSSAPKNNSYQNPYDRDDLKDALGILRKNEDEAALDSFARKFNSLSSAGKDVGDGISAYDKTKKYTDKYWKPGGYVPKGASRDINGNIQSDGYDETIEERKWDFQMDPVVNKKHEAWLAAQKKDEPKKPNKPGFMSDIGAAGKAAFQAFNPFDDVSMKEATENFMNRKPTDQFNEVARGANRAVDSASLGAMSNLDKRLNNRDPYYTEMRKMGEGGGTDMITSGLGYLVPGVGAYKALNATKAGKGLTQLGSQGIKQRLAAEAAKGSIAGGAMAGAEVGIREGLNPDDYNWKQNAGLIGLGVAGGAIADPLLYGAGKAVGKGFEKAAGKAMKDIMPSDEEAARTIANMIRQSREELLGLPAPKPEPLGLPEPQLKLPTPKPLVPDIKRPQAQLDSPIPQIPNVLRQPLAQARLESKGLGFGVGSKYEVKASNRMMLPELRQNQSYWQKRYEDFAKHVNSSYDMNRMTPEALEDIWTQFARYDEPVKLDEVIDLAYPKGFEAPVVPKQAVPEPVPIQEPPARTIKDDLKADPRINELTKSLYPPKKPISRVATRDEVIKMMEETVAAQKKPEDILKPLQFKRTIPANQEVAVAVEQAKPIRDFETVTPGKASNQKIKEVNPALLDEQRQATGNADSFRSKVDRKQTKENKLKDIFSNLRTQFIDDLAPLEKLEKNVRGTVASAEDSLYKQGRLFRGSSEQANQIVETHLNPILKNVKAAGFTADDLGDYALAVHAKDVNAKGINSGFTNAEINAVLKKFDNPALEDARQALMKLNNDLLDNLADAGIMSKGTVEQLRKTHPNYMPLFRSFDDDKIEFAAGLQQSLANVSNPIKRLEGSDRAVIDPIESVIKNIFKLTNAADRNRVAGQLGKLAKEDTGNAFIRPLGAGEEVGRKNVVSAWENGKKVQYEVQPEVYKALMNLDKESSNFLIKILQKPAGTLRAGATLTPEFSLRNPMRDVLQAFVVSNSGFNPLTDFTVGLFQSALKGKSIKIAGKEFKAPDQLYRQFLQDNGGLGNIVSVDRDMHRKAIEDAFKGNDKRFINIVNPKSWVGVLRAIADVSESATKVGEYRAALRSGVSRQEAAYRARDIMDFARAGVSVREANKVVAFLNANIQGKSKLLRAIKENPVKVTTKSLTAITLPTVGVFMAQQYFASDEQKKLIDDAPSWLKNTFWLVPVPGTEQVARIPKPFDLAPIFANLPERSLEYLVQNDPAAFDNFARETFSSYTIPTMLTGLAPIIEGMANYSFFRDAPIIPAREKSLQYPDQYDINTSETAKVIGKGVNMLTGGSGTLKNFGSPRVVDNTIRGLTGGLGTYATDIVDLIVEGSGLVDDAEKPKKDFLTEKTPLKAFLMNKSSTGKSVDKLYTLKDKLGKERGSSKDKGKPYEKEMQYKFVNEATKDIGEISKQIRQIENAPDMTGEQKRQLIDAYNKRRNELAIQTMKAMQAQNK
jgi:hypothetical protein